jgi:glycosyltransferase 2 family protein
MRVLGKKTILQFGKAVLTSVLLYFLFTTISWTSLSSALVHAHLGWFLFALAAAIGVTFLSGWRWHLLLRSIGIESPPFSILVYYYFVSNFFNNFAPANLAGDALRVNVLYRHRKNGVGASGSVILERLLSLLGLVVICSWAVISQPLPITLHVSLYMVQVVVFLVIIGTIVLTLGLMYFPLKARFIWSGIAQLLGSIRNHPGQFGQAVVVTMFLHFATMLITLGSLQAVAVPLSIPIHLAIYSIAGILLTLPVTIQGIGVREGVYVGLLGLVKVNPEYVLAAMALNYIILILLSVCGGILFYRGPRYLREQVV